MDKGYNNYKQFARFTQKGIYFITRQKDNAVYTSVSERLLGANTPQAVLKDEIILQLYKDDNGKSQISWNYSVLHVSDPASTCFPIRC
jgi:hypothetical protein